MVRVSLCISEAMISLKLSLVMRSAIAKDGAPVQLQPVESTSLCGPLAGRIFVFTVWIQIRTFQKLLTLENDVRCWVNLCAQTIFSTAPECPECHILQTCRNNYSPNEWKIPQSSAWQLTLPFALPIWRADVLQIGSRPVEERTSGGKKCWCYFLMKQVPVSSINACLYVFTHVQIHTDRHSRLTQKTYFVTFSALPTGRLLREEVGCSLAIVSGSQRLPHRSKHLLYQNTDVCILCRNGYTDKAN